MPPARTPRAMNAITSRPSIAISTQSVLLVSSSSSGGAGAALSQGVVVARSWCRRWLQSSWRPRTSRRGQRRRRAAPASRAAAITQRARGGASRLLLLQDRALLSLAQRLLEVGVGVGDLLEGLAALDLRLPSTLDA